MAINWDNLGSGLFSTGMGLFGADQQRKADEKRLAAARGPVYNAATGAAAGAVGEAAMDPQAAAAQQYAQQSALVAPTREKQVADMQRNLLSKGLLGVSNYNPGVAGIQSGQKMNPHMAAMFAGQSSADAKMAADAMAAADARRTGAAGRAATLQGTAGAAQNTGMAPYQRGSGVSSVGKSIMPGLFQGIGSLVKDSGVLSSIFGGKGAGMFGSAGGNMVDPYNYGSGMGFGDLRQQDFSGGYY